MMFDFVELRLMYFDFSEFVLWVQNTVLLGHLDVIVHLQVYTYLLKLSHF
jgi:hypothetical protein